MSVNVDHGETILALSSRVARRVLALKAFALRWQQALSRGSALYRSRRQLLELSDAQLRDIGLTRREAAAEARRGFGGG
ncbi:DUF1127 domain-containing protein [Aureimonas glaciei]|uniref:YjiS-like domain-containing protein n=1 Tax=Aureimonas glaciei TaxID=1776957 RepID=A0A917DBB3_9HYPH|nr:DUF1127 domain-containing protein [Aureimonas glaciei]GGD22340.1 hypothetical protein GCM10011335_26520 [Aureimonas glaciei]